MVKISTESMPMKPLLIIKRAEPEPHYEVHFNDHVEFRQLDGTLLGKSKVYDYEEIKDKDWNKLNFHEGGE